MDHKVLIVDDDVNLLSSLKRALHKEPYEILLARSADEALGILDVQEVDAVVTDQAMAGLSGTEFLRIVRQKYPDTARFMLTGKATLEVALKAINEGEITHFFQKPCSHIYMTILIRQAIIQRMLLKKVRELMDANLRKQALIEELERKFPGISRIDRDGDGTVLINDPEDCYREFLMKLRGTFAVEERV